MQSGERRRYPRVASEAILQISHPAFGAISLKAKDASEGGFFALRGSQSLPPVDTEVAVIIKRYTGALNDDPVKMRVVRENEEGIGLAFLS